MRYGRARGGRRAEEPRAGEPPSRFGESRFYRALAAADRRRLLYYLLETPETTVEELATVLSGWEVTTTGTMHTQADRSKIRLELVHVHLPQLADAGLLDYDPENGSVRAESLHPQVGDLIRRSIDAGAGGEC